MGLNVATLSENNFFVAITSPSLLLLLPLLLQLLLLLLLLVVLVLLVLVLLHIEIVKRGPTMTPPTPTARPCQISALFEGGFLRSRCSMRMWCPDDIGRDSWGRVVAGTW